MALLTVMLCCSLQILCDCVNVLNHIVLISTKIFMTNLCKKVVIKEKSMNLQKYIFSCLLIHFAIILCHLHCIKFIKNRWIIMISTSNKTVSLLWPLCPCPKGGDNRWILVSPLSSWYSSPVTCNLMHSCPLYSLHISSLCTHILPTSRPRTSSIFPWLLMILFVLIFLFSPSVLIHIFLCISVNICVLHIK